MTTPKPFPENQREIGKALTQEAKLHLFRAAARSRRGWWRSTRRCWRAGTPCRGVELNDPRWRDVVAALVKLRERAQRTAAPNLITTSSRVANTAASRSLRRCGGRHSAIWLARRSRAPNREAVKKLPGGLRAVTERRMRVEVSISIARTRNGPVRHNPRPIVMVGAAGLEPATPCLEGRCSIRLSYAPVPVGFLPIVASGAQVQPRARDASPTTKPERARRVVLQSLQRCCACSPRPIFPTSWS